MRKLKVSLFVFFIGFLSACGQRAESDNSITFAPATEEFPFLAQQVLELVTGSQSPFIISAELPIEARYEISIFADEYFEGNLVNSQNLTTMGSGDLPEPANSKAHFIFIPSEDFQQNHFSLLMVNDEDNWSRSSVIWESEYMGGISESLMSSSNLLTDPVEVELGQEVILALFVATEANELAILSDLQEYLNPELFQNQGAFANFTHALVIRANVSNIE